MADTSFNIIGSSMTEEVLKCRHGARYDIKASVLKINPFYISEGEMETIAADKAEWIVIDTAYFSCGVEFAGNISVEIDNFIKFLKKNWHRKIVLIAAKPCSYRMGDSAVYAIRDAAPCPLSDELCFRLLSALNCYVVTMPFDCISSDGRPFHYIPVIKKYIKSVIDVITVKCDRNAIDRITAETVSEISAIQADTFAGTAALRKAYEEALAEGNLVDAYSATAELAARGDPNAILISERDYRPAAKAADNVQIRLKWLRTLSDAGLIWPKHHLFDVLWGLKTPEAYEEMIAVESGPAEQGVGASMRRIGRAYREGRGVPKDLETALMWGRKAYETKALTADMDLYDTLLKVGTPDAYKEMIKVIEPAFKKNELGAVVRMARAYRDGKGVGKDLKKSAELFGKAAAAKPVYQKELDEVKKLL
ncbi:MAG: sel1 repeat family protein [Candidatus Methanomethylophilaceae archaeon]|nr:sel1 repeat family protein [Candidatus Methanomethylophilaceae archaeon]